MAIKAVLFDLDGTLLPMDQEVFVKAYFKGLVTHLAPMGYEPEGLTKAIWGGTDMMIKNTGECRNEKRFWDFFCSLYGEEALNDMPHFEEFYRTGFQSVQSVCGYRKESGELVRFLKERGIRTVLATNPIFPAIATESRMRWAGLSPDDFELYTTYENINYCKPSLEYYKDILNRLNLSAEECIMVGNDVDDDMVARNLGMQVFLLTDDLINYSGADISIFPNGDFKALTEFIEDKTKDKD
ncbi:MAG: HAD family hydrolase [Clostridia bacterium]|nr:HAD family hydrolase [Clostridia bacterium]